jgi:SAM-dependent methyltransferase
LDEIEFNDIQVKVLEMGCGVGNSLFPLITNNSDKFFYAFDVSPTAINILKKNPQYDENRCKAFLCDIVKEELPEEIRVEKLDLVLSIFCLSAIPPEHMPSVLQKIFIVHITFDISHSHGCNI